MYSFDLFHLEFVGIFLWYVKARMCQCLNFDSATVDCDLTTKPTLFTSICPSYEMERIPSSQPWRTLHTTASSEAHPCIQRELGANFQCTSRTQSLASSGTCKGHVAELLCRLLTILDPGQVPDIETVARWDEQTCSSRLSASWAMHPPRFLL